MITISKLKDFQDLWCMSLSALGGKATKREIGNFVEDLIKDDLVSIPFEWRGSWQTDMGHQKTNLKTKGIIKVEKIGSQHYWSFAD